MLQLQHVSPQTQKKLNKALNIIGDEELFALDLVGYKKNELKKANFAIRHNMHDFEEQYQMTTTEFYDKFEQGILGDAMDYMEWAGLFELYKDNQKVLEALP